MMDASSSYGLKDWNGRYIAGGTYDNTLYYKSIKGNMFIYRYSYCFSSYYNLLFSHIILINLFIIEFIVGTGMSVRSLAEQAITMT